MLNRRDMLLQGLASTLLTLRRGDALATERTSIQAAEPLRILVLGGTGRIGPHHVHAALQRGHRVSVFSRGKGHADLPPEVEQLIGDRNGDLEAIKNRDWDAVLDLATFVPAWIRTLGEALHGRVKHYTFISTVAVYDSPGDNAHGTDESARLLEYKDSPDPYTLTEPGSQYGSLKALCERESEEQFPKRALILRPGYITGPDDAWGVLGYWCARLKKGGEVLAPEDHSAPAQWIDVRDLAEWAIRLLERRATGVFNAIGPARPATFTSILKRLSAVPHAAPTRFTWVPTAWLVNENVSPLGNLLFWPKETGTPGLMHMRNEKARAAGLSFRTLVETATDTLAWYEAQPKERHMTMSIGLNGEPQSIEESMVDEQKLLTKWHTANRDA